jgi:HK97 family phage prohead protease
MSGKKETRAFGFEYRAGKDAEKTGVLSGHAAVFNVETNIGGFFREVVAPGAFLDSIQTDDVRALWNHDPNIVLGRNRAGTLRLQEDARGLAVEIDAPKSGMIHDLVVGPIERGDVSQMSYAFEALAEAWNLDADPPIRTVTRVRLYDVSPVTYPAEPTTDVAARSLEEARSHAEAIQASKTRGDLEIERRRLDLEESEI